MAAYGFRTTGGAGQHEALGQYLRVVKDAVDNALADGDIDARVPGFGRMQFKSSVVKIQRVPTSVLEGTCGGYHRAMPSPRRLLAAIGVTFAIVLLSPIAPAHADDALQACIDQGEFHDGEPPTCTEVDGGYEASWPDDATAGTGGFVALFVIASLAGVAVLVWKVSTARRLATQSGMDPNLATQMALLTDDGLNSTYLAANLRHRADAPVASTPSTTTATAPAAQRLAELRGLLDDGLITQAEFDGRRTAIIDGV